MYQGHLNDGSSVQAHSAGPLYPFVIFAKETIRGLKYGVIEPTGQERLFGSHGITLDIATRMKAAYDLRATTRSAA